MNYKVFNKKYFLGDIHGHWGIIANHIIHNEDKNVGYFQVGDFGIGFFELEKELERLKKLNDILNEYDCDLYVVRGNHDNPAWFREETDEKIVAAKLQLDRIFFLPDYTVLNIDLENILFVGGAVSIDRIPRRMETLYQAWFEDEPFVLDKERLQNLEGIERVVTHTAPNFCFPLNLNGLVYEYAKKDGNLLQDLREERDLVTEMANIIMLNGKNQLRGWYYGHFHADNRFVHSNAEFVCLGVDKFMRI